MLDQTKIERLEKIDPTLVQDLLEEIGEKNTVRVYKTEAGKKPELHSDSRVDPSTTAVTIPMLLQQDRLRVSAGLKPIYTEELMRRKSMELIGFTKNLRTSTGIDYCATQLGSAGSAASATAVAKYIAVSNCTSAPSATNTATTAASGTQINWGTANATDAAAGTSRGEMTALGFARVLATQGHVTGTASYTETALYTSTSTTVTALQACGIFASSAQGVGPLFCENTFTPTTFGNTDQLTIAWTFNI